MASLAAGAGRPVATIKINEAPALITLEGVRLPALDDAHPAGGPDDDGFDLHVLYEGTRTMLLEESDGARKVLRVEFDVTPVLIVPYCGVLSLVGGAGRYRWSISEPKLWHGVYRPSWHALTRMLGRDVSFTVPDGHTEIGSFNTGSTFNAADGETWFLDGSAKPVGSGTQATPEGQVRIFTRVFF